MAVKSVSNVTTTVVLLLACTALHSALLAQVKVKPSLYVAMLHTSVSDQLCATQCVLFFLWHCIGVVIHSAQVASCQTPVLGYNVCWAV